MIEYINEELNKIKFKIRKLIVLKEKEIKISKKYLLIDNLKEK